MRTLFSPLAVCSLALFAVLSWASPAFSQHGHSDVEFEYSGGAINILHGPAGAIFESEFPTSGLFQGKTDAPGFASEISEGLGIQPNNIIGYNVLQNLFYWDGTSEQTPTASLTIEHIVGPHTVVNATSGFQGVDFSALKNLIGQADAAGDFHSHIDFVLDLTAPLGAYGLLLSLATDEPGVGNSKPFGIIFNYGLDDDEFEAGVEYFLTTRGLAPATTPIPEPSSWLAFVICGLGLFAGGCWRRAKRQTA